LKFCDLKEQINHYEKKLSEVENKKNKYLSCIEEISVENRELLKEEKKLQNEIDLLKVNINILESNIRENGIFNNDVLFKNENINLNNLSQHIKTRELIESIIMENDENQLKSSQNYSREICFSNETQLMSEIKESEFENQEIISEQIQRILSKIEHNLDTEREEIENKCIQKARKIEHLEGEKIAFSICVSQNEKSKEEIMVEELERTLNVAQEISFGYMEKVKQLEKEYLGLYNQMKGNKGSGK
jgi:hypothetical protein